MLALLDKHSYIAIFLAVLLEELGIPMPIPTDLLIIFAGVKGNRNVPDLALWFVLLNIASAIGASGLYLIVRRGGRPLSTAMGAMFTWVRSRSSAPSGCWRAAAGGASQSAARSLAYATWR
jgi:membrane protein DedA with SNARE-associated domain